MHRGLEAYAGSGCRMGLPLYYNLIADACLRLRLIEDGEQALARGLEAVGSTGERSWEAELHRLQGELALAGMESGGPDRAAEAAACFQRAIATARELGAPSSELRAATSLGRLALAQGRRDQARALVAEAHGRFTEGFATADLADAEALIRQASA
jgi:predicted ATPase